MPNDDEVALIAEVVGRWAAALADGDVPALAALMTDDVVVIHGDGRVVEGRDAVADDLARSLASMRILQRIHSEETVVAGEWAFDRAAIETIVTPRPEGPSRRWDSHVLTILRKDGAGRWRVARTMGVVLQPGVR